LINYRNGSNYGNGFIFRIYYYLRHPDALLAIHPILPP
jgi:hypothetical protein